VYEASADQFPNASPSGVLGIVSLRISMKNEDQLVHRQPGRVFIEEERQDGALRSLVYACGRGGIERCPTRRVLISHGEVRLLVVRLPVGVTALAGSRF
jgi:hypothetical protein